MKRLNKSTVLVLAVVLLACTGFAAEGKAATAAKPALEAVLLGNERHGFFTPREEVRIALRYTAVPADTLLWEVRNYLGDILESGQSPVAGTGEQVIAPSHHGGGYYELYARLKDSGASIPALGSRPAGFICYGELPGIEPLALASPEDSRFGIQGTAFVQSGRHGAGDPLNPLFGFLGVKWVYVGMRGQDVQPQEAQPFIPQTSAEALQGRHHNERSGGLAPFWDMHGMPAWMLKAPTPVTEPETKNATMFCQLWPPRDYAEYGEFVGKIARQVSATRKYCFPYIRKNYYQIHWEPDWHWRGLPEEFVQVYKTAYEAIHRNDPDAVLTGANYGVFAKGNTLLEELFAKGLGNYIDGITFHAYRLEGPWEDHMIGEMRRLVAMKRKYLKPEARMFQTEWGESYPTEYVVPAIPRQELLREMAANMRGHLIILGEGADTTFFFYAVDHTPQGFGLVYNLDFPQIPFGPTRIAPKPWAMAACAMTRLLEGTQSLGSLGYLGDGAYGYLFRRGPELLAAMWTSDEKHRTIRLNAGSARVSVIDCMGQSKTVETQRGEFDLLIGPIPVYVTGLLPESVAVGDGEPLVGGTPLELQNGSYRLQRGGEVRHFEVTSERKFLTPKDLFGNCLLSRLDAATGCPLESSSLKILKPFELARELKRIGLGEYQVAIRNHTGDTIRGTLNGTQAVTLPPNAVTVVTFSQGVAGGDTVTAEFKTEDGERQSFSMKKTADLPAVYREKDPPVIDGRLEDWRLEHFTPMREKANLAFAKAPWTGPGDFSVLYAFAYDATNFYFAVKVADDRHNPPLKEDAPWRGDSIQLAFGFAPDVQGRAKIKRTFSFHLGRDGLARVKSLDALIPPAVNKVFRPDELHVKIVRDDIALQTVYEGAIPCTLITADGRKPDYIGLGGLINDADSEGEITGDGRKTMNIGASDVLFTLDPSFLTICFKLSEVTK